MKFWPLQTQQCGKQKRIFSIKASAYEVFYAKKERPLSASPSPKGVRVGAEQESVPSAISIREMLSGVKDYDGILYLNGQELSQNAQQSAVETEQKAAVRKQYEGTEQWMKAPNGKPKNSRRISGLPSEHWFGEPFTLNTQASEANLASEDAVSQAVMTAEAKLKADAKAWKETLKSAWKGAYPDGKLLRVMQHLYRYRLLVHPIIHYIWHKRKS